MCSNGFFGDPVLALGSDEQKEKWLRPLAGPDGVFTALATTEPGSGSDSAAIITHAKLVDGGYEISGQKAWISNAGLADQYVVFAKTDPTKRSGGVSAFLLKKGAEGMTFGKPMKKMGQRAIVCREIFFRQGLRTRGGPARDEGRGFYGLMATFDISRVVLAAAATGAARAAYEYALDYSRTLRQFGEPIIEHQAVAFRLADMATRIESSWLLTLHAARQLDAGENANGIAAMAKLQASETAMFSTRAAVQTLGGLLTRVPR